MRRFKPTRESFISPSYREILREDSLGVVVYACADGATMLAFSGKRQKPDFHYSFRGDRARAEAHVANWLAGIKKAAEAKAAKRTAAKDAPNPLEVGAVLKCSWGYEQTNVDYYEVTKRIGKRMVEIREIGQKSENTTDATGQCVPVPGMFIGEPMRRRVDEFGAVKINSHSWARRKECTEVAGVKVFAPDSWTAYA